MLFFFVFDFFFEQTILRIDSAEGENIKKILIFTNYCMLFDFI